MAARVFLQRTAAAPVAASLLLGGTMMYPRTAFAEAPEAFSKKPIYDDYEAPTPAALSASATISATPAPTTTSSSSSVVVHKQHGPTPTDRLAGQIRKVRLFLYRQARATEDGVNNAADRVFSLERSFTETLASLAPPRESGERLMPGAVYVLVAAMAGSMVTRRSNILLRATLPVVFGVGTGYALLPITSRNVGDLLWTYEQRVPAVAQAHLQTRETLTRWADTTKVHAQLGKDKASEKVAAVRETVEDWVKQGK